MRQIFPVALTILFLSGAVFAQPKEAPAPDKPKKEEQQVEASKNPKKKKPQHLEPVWPPPFVPSEEVGADSVISFPTDI